jgi:hypothetical protein
MILENQTSYRYDNSEFENIMDFNTGQLTFESNFIGWLGCCLCHRYKFDGKVLVKS